MCSTIVILQVVADNMEENHNEQTSRLAPTASTASTSRQWLKNYCLKDFKARWEKQTSI